MTTIDDLRLLFPDLADLRHLATTGQKIVYRCTRNGQQVVLKLIKAAQIDDARTEREIAAVSQLDSPYVPRVMEHGIRDVNGERRYFIVEPFIEGETLRTALQRQPIRPLREVLGLLATLLDACVDFEANRMVHRDIKPENLIVGTDAKLWVIDFGIVRMLDMESVTQTSDRFGPCTLGYGAPEQIRNLKGQVNSRADLFSVGVVAYEALCGSNPYLAGKRDVLEVLKHMESRDLVPLVIAGDVGNALSEFLRALTSRFPTRRPQTAVEGRDWFRTVEVRLGTGASTP